MPAEDYDALTPQLQRAVDELQHLIRRVDPLATFQVVPGDDPTGTYVLATVNVEDTELVMDAYMDRLLTLQIDEGLPLYVPRENTVLHYKHTKGIIELHQRSHRAVDCDRHMLLQVGSCHAVDDFRAAFFTALGLLVGLDRDLVAIVRLSLTVSLSAVGLATVLGLPLGAAVAVWRFPGRPWCVSCSMR